MITPKPKAKFGRRCPKFKTPNSLASPQVNAEPILEADFG